MAETVALIPAHNEALTVRAVVDATRPHVDRVIVVDDGSTDATADCLRGSGCEIIRHDTNLGKGACLVAGLNRAFAGGAGVVVVLDADQQHDPEDIPRFLQAHARNPDAFVLGERSADMARMPAYRRRGIKFGNFFISWACRQRIRDAQCGMRAYPRSMWAKLDIPPRHTTGFKFETAALMYAAKAGTHFVYVPVAARYEGYVLRPSHFDPVRDFARLFGLVTVFLAQNRFCASGFLRAVGLTGQVQFKEMERP